MIDYGYDTRIKRMIMVLYEKTKVKKLNISAICEDSNILDLFKSKDMRFSESEIYGFNLGIAGIPGWLELTQILQRVSVYSYRVLLNAIALSMGKGVFEDNYSNILGSGTELYEIGTVDSLMPTTVEQLIEVFKSREIDDDVATYIASNIADGKGISSHDRNSLENLFPQFFVESISRIKSMVTNKTAATRAKHLVEIAWFKINYPEAFYETYFNVLSTPDTFTYHDAFVDVDVHACKAKTLLVVPKNEMGFKQSCSCEAHWMAWEMFSAGYEFRKIQLTEDGRKVYTIKKIGSYDPVVDDEGLPFPNLKENNDSNDGVMYIHEEL